MFELLNFSISDWRGAIAGSVLTCLFWVLGLVITNLILIKRYMLVRNLWKPFIHNKKSTNVILTTKPSARKSGTQKVSLSEVKAFSELRNTLSQLHVNLELEQKPDMHLSDLEGKNVISIGGPISNNVTKEALGAVIYKYGMLPFSYNDSENCLFAQGVKYISVLANDEYLAKDYGLVIRATNLNNGLIPSCLIAFALRGHGTWGAVKALTTDNDLIKKIENEVGSKDFTLMLEFEFNRNELVGTRILGANTLIPLS